MKYYLVVNEEKKTYAFLDEDNLQFKQKEDDLRGIANNEQELETMEKILKRTHPNLQKVLEKDYHIYPEID